MRQQGKCCKGMPGSSFPSDFLPDIRKGVKEALKSGRWTIDWWEGDPRDFAMSWMYEHDTQLAGYVTSGYYLRPATKGKEGQLRDPSWGRQGCTFLRSDGCELSPQERPKDCRVMEPISGGPCNFHGHRPKQDAAIAWIPFHSLLSNFSEKE